MNKDKLEFFNFRNYIWAFIIGIALVSFFAIAFYIGAFSSCNNGGGYLNGLECKNVSILGVCHYKGIYIDYNKYKYMSDIVLDNSSEAIDFALNSK